MCNSTSYQRRKKEIVGKYKNIIFTVLGIALVAGITLLMGNSSFEINLNSLNILTGIYVFFAASIAITAMVLPGISGSTLLLVFGLYIPIMTKIKAFLSLDFSSIPILMIFGFGIIFGVVFFVKLIRKCLEKYRSQVIYAIIGMMIGSLYSIVMGPTTLDVPQAILSFKTFDILFFVIGCAVIVLLEVIKHLSQKQD